MVCDIFITHNNISERSEVKCYLQYVTRVHTRCYASSTRSLRWEPQSIALKIFSQRNTTPKAAENAVVPFTFICNIVSKHDK